VLYGKYEHLLRLANQYHYFIPDDRIPYKLQPGNPNYELSYGCAGIAEYLAELGVRAGAPASAPVRQKIEAAFAGISQHEQTLAERLLGYLRTKPGVRVIGSPRADGSRVPTISFVAGDKDSEAIVRHIDGLGVGIRFGDFHSRRLVDHLGLSPRKGVVRVSMVHYNTLEEVDRLILGLEEVLVGGPSPRG
jgi:selenocysteine lyase/cysteine desulfurase